MANIFDYLAWRGDLDFQTVPLNAVDALIFSALAYVNFSGIVPEEPEAFISLQQAADGLFVVPDIQKRSRIKSDLELLERCAASKRFGACRVGFYRDVLIREEETQFAAMTFLLSDGSAMISFRGTDSTMTGWKEDFNMSFQATVPAQLAAVAYADALARRREGCLRLCGHSKGGNLAVYAASKCARTVRGRILDVYNNDGPGFHHNMMTDPGYLAVVPRVHTYVPQSSVIGMLLEHEEPYVVVKSAQLGLLQHDPYSWMVLGGDFVRQEEITAESKFVDHAMKAWLADMTIEQRNAFVDTVFELMESSGVERTQDLFRVRSLAALIKSLRADEDAKKLIYEGLGNLLQAAAKSQKHRRESGSRQDPDALPQGSEPPCEPGEH